MKKLLLLPLCAIALIGCNQSTETTSAEEVTWVTLKEGSYLRIDISDNFYSGYHISNSCKSVKYMVEHDDGILSITVDYMQYETQTIDFFSGPTVSYSVTNM